MINIAQSKKSVNNFLELLGYGPNDKVYLRCFTLSGEARKPNYLQSKINYKTLQRWNGEGFGIYVVVNGGGDSDKDVCNGKAIFYEHDDLPKEEQKQLWQKLGLPEPTMQVDTGGKSIHSYWVFNKPSDVEEWKKLQADLLEFSDADRSIKNPSRVMRLPGFAHQETGNQAEIISQSGKRYSYEELREAISETQTQTLNFPTPTITHLDAVPLEACLTKDDRALISSGEGEGKRNSSGAKLARNLIGTAKRLDYLGHNYTGAPSQLFDDYCSHCTPFLDSKEAGLIWKSAEKDNPTASLTDDALENCVKAWHKNQQKKQQAVKDKPRGFSTSKQQSDSKVTPIKERWGEEKVIKIINELAQERLSGSQLTKALKTLSFCSQWDYKTLEKLYKEVTEEFDRDAELEDDEKEFSEILSADEPLDCSKILPEHLHPLLKFAENLGVRPEPVLIAFEAAASSLIDAKTRVIGRNCSDYDQNPTIFSAIVGEPGAKKSPIIRAIASKPLQQIQQEAQDKYESARIEYERELAEWENGDKEQRGDKPTPPQERIYAIGDYTPEGLRELSQYNPKALRLFDELARENKSRGQYKGGKGGEAQQILESYDGYLHSTVRRNKNYSACAVNQPVLGGIQPGVLSQIMSSADPTGEFARYNIAILPKKPHFWGEDSKTSIDINPLLVSAYKAIDNLPSMIFRLSPEASEAFNNCHNVSEQKAHDADKPALVYQYLKADGKILRLAMLYHIVYAVVEGKIPSEIIDKKFITIARHRMRYQINQVKALLARMDETIPSKLVQIYEYAKRKGELAPSQLKNAGHAKNAAEAIEYFKRLEQMGWGETFPSKRTVKFRPFEEKRDAELKVTYGELTVDNRKNSKPDTASNTPSPDKLAYGSTVNSSKSDTASSTALTYGNYGHNSHDSGESEIVDSTTNTTDSTKEVTYGKPPVNDRKNSKPDTASSKASNYGKQLSHSTKRKISDFKIGQKATYNNSPWDFEIASINESKGYLIDKDGAKFHYSKCQVVNY